MFFSVLAMVTSLATFLSPAAEAATCTPGIVEMHITTTSDVQTVMDELKCTGPGAFNITWHSSLQIRKTIAVSNQKNISITGFGYPTIRAPLVDNNDSNIESTGSTATTGVFSVSNGSILRLNNMTLEGGYASYGGAVSVATSSSLFVFGCTFVSNRASYIGGAIYAYNSDIYIDGYNVFANNSAGNGGGVVAYLSELHMDGTTDFINNSADAHGGGVIAYLSELYMDGTTDFINNSAAEHGGGVFAKLSEVHMHGTIDFNSNLADTFGGAMYANNSVIYVDGSNVFANNLALSGGGVFVHLSDLHLNGTNYFVNNSADQDGGGVLAANSYVHVNGSTDFINNSADLGGGATSFQNCSTFFDGDTLFSHNSAKEGGGLYARHWSSIVMDGRTIFLNNSAGSLGGAIHAASSAIDLRGDIDASYNFAVIKGGAIFVWSAEVRTKGNTTFSFNTAGWGGAIAGELSNITITGSTERSVAPPDSEGSIAGELSNITVTGNTERSAPPDAEGSTDDSARSVEFIGNSALDGGGAMHALACDSIEVSNAKFEWNKGVFGGAVYISLEAEKKSQFSNCVFDGNEGENGGAVYLYTGSGVDTFTSSVFRHNYAEVSGGAIFHTGSLFVSNTSFLGNEAGTEGAAVMSIGRLKELYNVYFSRNMYHCGAREYGYIVKNKDGFCSSCLAEVCSRCSAGGEGVISPDLVQIDGLAVCAKAPLGTTAPLRGTTVETLVLEKGYYRTSNQSHVIFKCFQKDACIGGNANDNICDVGYKGPYCAVCTDGFAPGIAYSCRECSGNAKHLAVGMLALGGLAVLLLTALLVWRLGTVGGERTTQGVLVTHSSWQQKKWSCQNLRVNTLPLSAIKIVVTVWQIIYQFAAITGDVYPEIYAKFVLKLYPINLDIGFMLSHLCLVNTDFYDRLIIVTIMPPLMLVTLVGSYLIGKKRNRTSEIAISVVKHRHQSAALLLAFWVYSSVSHMIFQTFSCDDLGDGKAYLRADYSLECSTTRHTTFKTYSLVMACVYPVGIPAVFAWCLARNRGDLVKSDRDTQPHLESLNTLWAAYKPSRYFFELVECTRRIALTGIAAFVPPNSAVQISMVLLVAVAFEFLSESMAPFEKVADEHLYRWGNGVIVGSLYVAFLLKVNLADESQQSIRQFSGVLVAANVVMILAVLVQTVLLVKEWRGARQRVRLVEIPIRRASSLTGRSG